MNAEVFHHYTERGTNIMEGIGVEESVSRFIRQHYDLADYTVSLHIVLPTQPTPRSMASEVSLRKKMSMLAAIGVRTDVAIHQESSKPDALVQALDQDNNDQNTIGVIIQLPVPSRLDGIQSMIDLQRDIDGINPSNHIWNTCATAEATLRLLEAHGRYIRKVGVVGAKGFVGSNIRKGIKERDLAEVIPVDKHDSHQVLLQCDTIVSAVGEPGIIQGHTIDEHGAFLGIDIGNTRVDGLFRGDFDFDTTDGLLDFLTPVPGGMGPLEMVILSERVVQNAIDPSFRVNFVIK